MATGYEDLLPKKPVASTGYEDLLPRQPQALTGYEDLLPKKEEKPALSQALPSPAKPAAPVEFEQPSIDYGEAATGMMSPAPSRRYGVEDVVGNKQEFELVQRFMKERYPNKKLPTDPLQLVSEFRKSQAKTDAGLANELSWALNATPQQKEIAQQAYALSDKLGMDLGAEILATLKSPSTYFGGVAGWAAKQAALRGVKTSIKAALNPATVMAVTEGAVTGGRDVVEQKTRVALGVQEEVNYAQTALNVGISTTLGYIGGKELAEAPLKTTQQRVASLVERRKIEAGETIDKPTADFLKQFAQREKKVAPNDRALFADQFSRKEARESSLDVMDKPEVVTQSVLNDKIVGDMFKVAKQIYADYPLLRPDLNEIRITQAVINTLDEADPDILQQAIKRAGVDSQQFFDAFKVTVSQAGVVLNEGSKLSRFLNKAAKGDPELEKALDNMAKASQNTSYTSGTGIEIGAKVVGTSVAASTAGLSTAVLNAVGLSASVPLKVAADTIDVVTSTTWRMVNDMRGGVIPTKVRVKEDIAEALADSAYVMTRMVDAGYTNELADLMLKNNPRLYNMLKGVGGETAIDSTYRFLPKVLDTINIFNRAVDGVVRRPFFVQSVKERMEAVGLDFRDFVVNNKPIPIAILREAVDESHKLTFSYSFKKTKEKSIEGLSENAAAYFLDLVNKNAGGTIIGKTAFPFLRFSLNAIRYMYRTTPFSGAGAIQEYSQARRFLKEGKIEEAAGLMYDAKKKAIDSIVGAGAITAAIAERMENSDIEYYQYRDEDGNVKDGSNIFPYVNFKVIAEFSLLMKDMAQNLWYTLKMSPEEREKEIESRRKQVESLGVNDSARQKLVLEIEQLELNRVRKFDGKKALEIMTGMGRSSVTQDTPVDRAIRLVEGGITENLERKVGTAVGDFIGRFDNFFNPLYDGANFLLEDYSVRDTRAPTMLEEKVGPAVDATIASLIGPIPVAREMLQEKPSLFQQEPQQVPLVLRQVQGVRPQPPTSRIENELARLRIPSFSVFKPTGDRTLDTITIKAAQPVFKQIVEDTIFNDPLYKQLSINGQRERIKKKMNDAIAAVKDSVQTEYLKNNSEDAVNRMYEKMSRAKREAAEDFFMKMNRRRPKTLKEKMDIIQGAYSISEGEVRKARGGLVEQSQQLFRR
jgi:hypothetical protein